MTIECAEITLHGRKLRYRTAGKGPLVVLLHGMASRAATWDTILPRLQAEHTVIAPDLLGHGDSAKPPGDYSLGAYANLVRDLLVALGQGPGTVVGHSLGGGVALQFAYQFPERCERLVLVASGGLGREVHPILRAATLPGAELVLPWLASAAARGIGALTKTLTKIGFHEGDDLGEAWRGFTELGQPEARRVFLETVRGIVDLGGQHVSAEDKLDMIDGMPTLIVWGDQDPLIPVSHAIHSHRRISGSRLEIFAGAGHYPFLHDPERFALLLLEFIRTTEPRKVADDSTPDGGRAGRDPLDSGTLPLDVSPSPDWPSRRADRQ